jgi:lipopolysaccharide export system protein LptA
MSCLGISSVRRLFVAKLLIGLLLSLGAGATAHAERADREKPINIEADRVSMDDAKKESTFDGNVSFTQGTLTLRADKVTVKQDAQGFNYAVAYGKPAHIRQKQEGTDEYVDGFADRLEYDGKADKVQMFGNAEIKKGTDDVRGDYISYDAVTEYYQVIGGGKIVGTPGNPEGRVRAVIQPKNKMDKLDKPFNKSDKPAKADKSGKADNAGGPQANANPAVPLKTAPALSNPPPQ